ncbi:hypothetical protein [Oceanibaculum nanhaiense]|uniref:hypothetical protein n=1 Tax=Oceanibaculum nanhaiense TaxID=1909734 RepID=UPI003D2A29CC
MTKKNGDQTVEIEGEKRFSYGRITTSGKTATYRVIFKNGVTVDLEAVELYYTQVGGGPKNPRFRAYYLNNTGYSDVAFGPNGGPLNSDDITAIIRLSEDKNGDWPQ